MNGLIPWQERITKLPVIVFTQNASINFMFLLIETNSLLNSTPRQNLEATIIERRRLAELIKAF